MSDPLLDTAPACIALPRPNLPTVTLEQALSHRCSMRAFAAALLSLKLLSALLWAAFGVNCRDSHGRTAPSAYKWQETDVAAVLPNGAYRCDARWHRLHLMLAQAVRASTGVQGLVDRRALAAPLRLVPTHRITLAQSVGHPLPT
jgi:hypothetical protein